MTLVSLTYYWKTSQDEETTRKAIEIILTVSNLQRQRMFEICFRLWILGQTESMVSLKPAFGLNKRYFNVLPCMKVLYRDSTSCAMMSWWYTAHIYQEIADQKSQPH
jgi:hypothetical protein